MRLKHSYFVIQKLMLRLIDSLKQRHWYLLTHLVKLIRLTKLMHSYFVIQKLTLRRIDSLKLRRLCFAIQRLTLRLTDLLKLRHSYLLILRHSLNQKLIGSLRLKRWCLLTH